MEGQSKKRMNDVKKLSEEPGVKSKKQNEEGANKKN